MQSLVRQNKVSRDYLTPTYCAFSKNIPIRAARVRTYSGHIPDGNWRGARVDSFICYDSLSPSTPADERHFLRTGRQTDRLETCHCSAPHLSILPDHTYLGTVVQPRHRHLLALDPILTATRDCRLGYEIVYGLHSGSLTLRLSLPRFARPWMDRKDYTRTLRTSTHPNPFPLSLSP